MKISPKISRRIPRLSMTAAGMLLLVSAGVSAAELSPQPDCKTKVWSEDVNAELPGYLFPGSGGENVCAPLLLTVNKPPVNYSGNDYYIDEFTDAKLKARWAECKADAACFARIDKDIKRWLPPNKARSTRVVGLVDPVGKIDPDGKVNLKDIRRPSFFAKAPYREAIAGAEGRTYTVEFTAPRDPLERFRLNLHEDIKLRGWYIEGSGVDNGHGKKERALVIVNFGGGSQLTAINHPNDAFARKDPATGLPVKIKYPNRTTEGLGMREWRENLHALNKAGFDVLAYDRRAVGLSGGFSDTNTLEQGEDFYRVLEQMENGIGLRLLTPKGVEFEGKAAAGKLMAGKKAKEIPLLFLGNSRGTMAVGWAMTKNYTGTCTYDLPTVTCSAPKGYQNIKGAMLYASFVSGAGYLPDSGSGSDRNLFLGGMAADHYIAFYPNSAVLASANKWPGVFIAKGVLDRAESLEGSVAFYDRVNGPKEIVVNKGAHSTETWSKSDLQYARSRMVSFAIAALQGKSNVPGAKPWSNIKELVGTTLDSGK